MQRIASRLQQKPAFAWLQIAVLLLAMLVPFVIRTERVDAAAQLTSRSFKMSTSASGATAVTGLAGFTVATTGNIGSVAIEACTSPIEAVACTAPTGLADWTESTVTLNTSTDSGITDWAGTPHANSTANRTVITRTAASVSASTAVTFELSGFDLPTGAEATFYVRFSTYTATDGTGTSVDFGGVAVATTDELTVTAKVQETLTFTLSSTAITLGDANGVISTTDDYYNEDATFSAATNANSGMIVRMKGTTLCRTAGSCGLAAHTISAVGATAATSSPGTEQFGMCVDESGGSVTPSSPYNHASCGDGTTGLYTGSAQFAFDNATACSNGENNTSCTYGDVIASSTGASTTTTGTLAFLANAANTTEPGIYTTTLTFIATGTF